MCLKCYIFMLGNDAAEVYNIYAIILLGIFESQKQNTPHTISAAVFIYLNLAYFSQKLAKQHTYPNVKSAS